MSYLDLRLRQRQPQTLPQLALAFQEEWVTIAQGVIHAVINSQGYPRYGDDLELVTCHYSNGDWHQLWTITQI